MHYLFFSWQISGINIFEQVKSIVKLVSGRVVLFRLEVYSDWKNILKNYLSLYLHYLENLQDGIFLLICLGTDRFFFERHFESLNCFNIPCVIWSSYKLTTLAELIIFMVKEKVWEKLGLKIFSGLPTDWAIEFEPKCFAFPS